MATRGGRSDSEWNGREEVKERSGKGDEREGYDIRSGHIRPDQVMLGHVRSGQVKSIQPNSITSKISQVQFIHSRSFVNTTTNTSFCNFLRLP